MQITDSWSPALHEPSKLPSNATVTSLLTLSPDIATISNILSWCYPNCQHPHKRELHFLLLPSWPSAWKLLALSCHNRSCHRPFLPPGSDLFIQTPSAILSDLPRGFSAILTQCYHVSSLSLTPGFFPSTRQHARGSPGFKEPQY
jgi:hypothetical protein